MPTAAQFSVSNDDKETVLTALRSHLPEKPSWTAARKLLRGRFVAIGGVLCLDEARRLTRGELVSVSEHPFPPPPTDRDVAVHYVDSEIIIVEKPAGMLTLRRKSDWGWSWTRKNQQPTLDECVPRIIGQHAARQQKAETNPQRLPKLLPVHRIDRDSSGLLVFARTEESQTRIIHQFAQHDAVRKYLALIPGAIANQTVTSQLIRDRGDGRRGSTADPSIGERAVTHFHVLRTIGACSELECRLETGRTNQIRIHLAELGHPICGDIKYRGPVNEPPVPDDAHVNRLALHAAELSFEHPTTGKQIQFETPWPPEMLRIIERLRLANTAVTMP